MNTRRTGFSWNREVCADTSKTQETCVYYVPREPCSVCVHTVLQLCVHSVLYSKNAWQRVCGKKDLRVGIFWGKYLCVQGSFGKQTWMCWALLEKKSVCVGLFWKKYPCVQFFFGKETCMCGALLEKRSVCLGLLWERDWCAHSSFGK